MKSELPKTEDWWELLDLLGKVIDMNRGGTYTDREIYAHNLANKFYNHSFISIYIINNKNQLDLPSGPIALSGFPSSDVLARAAIEAFLTFHYIFYAPRNNDDKNCKYWAYRLAGLMERRFFPTSSPIFKQKLQEDEKLALEFTTKLKSNSSFNKLSSGNRKKILRGEWRLIAWKDIIAEANLGTMFEHYYRYLCGYAHSGSLSVLQTAQAYQKNELNLLETPSIIAINILIANFTKEYCLLFPNCETPLDKEGKRLIDLWIYLGNSFDTSESDID